MKIAEALLLRKQLEAKVQQLQPLKMAGDNGVFETKVERRQVNDNVDEVRTQLPRITLADITKTYDHYASQLRKLDASIQKANWNFDVEFNEEDAPNTNPVPQPRPTETTPDNAS